jgi:hypothetical protein
MLTWHFVAPMVHDFAWAADKIMYDIVQGPNDVDLHFFYKTSQKRLKLEEMEPMMVNVMDFFNKKLGITRTNNIHLFKEMVEWNMR